MTTLRRLRPVRAAGFRMYAEFVETFGADCPLHAPGYNTENEPRIDGNASRLISETKPRNSETSRTRSFDFDRYKNSLLCFSRLRSQSVIVSKFLGLIFSEQSLHCCLCFHNIMVFLGTTLIGNRVSRGSSLLESENLWTGLELSYPENPQGPGHITLPIRNDRNLARRRVHIQSPPQRPHRCLPELVLRSRDGIKAAAPLKTGKYAQIVRETINALDGRKGIADEQIRKQREQIVRTLTEC